jgi:hypothetical protein
MCLLTSDAGGQAALAATPRIFLNAKFRKPELVFKDLRFLVQDFKPFELRRSLPMVV